MALSRTAALATASGGALALALLGTPAFAAAQPAGDLEDAPPVCTDLPAGEQRDRCLSGEVELESGVEMPATGGAIIVTGSRIQRPNVDSTVPITSVSAEEILNSGEVSLGDQLNQLPSLVNTFSTANSTRFIGTAGLSLLDLRGLGTSRTLVLVNNRRHVTGSEGSFTPDVNTIPMDLLERVDVITGGNSAVYGSDAIAGVVNFVLRRDYEGLRMRGQAGITERGDRGAYFAALVAGQNFADDRGNIAVALEYTKSEPLYFVERDEITGAFSGRCQYNLAEVTTDDGADNDDGIPDQLPYCGVVNSNVYDGGQITTVGACSGVNRLPEPLFSQRCYSYGQPRLFYFTPAGELVEDQFTGIDFRRFGSSNIQDGAGSTLRGSGQLAAGVTRYAANLLANFEISPAFRPFLEAKFVRVDSLQEGQPSFQVGFLSTFLGGQLSENLRCDNAFLSPQNLAQLQRIGRCTGESGLVFNIDGEAVELLPINRFNVDFGGRGEIGRRDTWRVVTGFDGDFNDDWSYEVSLNYGRLDTSLRSLNNLLIQEFLNAVNAARDAQGNLVCRINIDSNPDNNDPNCVPINLFGFGRPSQEALDYVNVTSTRDGNASQLQALAFVSGDSSQLFELPGGPIGFAVGAEYRRETAFQKYSPEVEQGLTFLNAIQEFDPPAQEVREAFAEIRIPVLRDLPMAEELAIELAGRFSDYNNDVGTVFAYNVGGIYSPVRDIRLRANYSSSVRAPNLGNLFSPQSQNFAQIQDPCDVLYRNNPARPARDANCTAAGLPSGFINQPARDSSTSFLTGGNPNLTEERSKSITIGAVIQPRWIPGLVLTVDYWDVTIDELIANVTAQTIINQCYDDPSGIDNAFCDIVFRNPDGTFAQPVATIAGPVNFAGFDASGIDFDLAYRRTLDNGDRISLRGIATRNLENTGYLDPTDPEFGNRFLSEIGLPAWAGSLTANYGTGPLEFTYTLRYVGRQVIAGFAYETFFPFQGRPATNPDATESPWGPDTFYHNLRVGMEVDDRFNFYAGVDNIFDTLPPFGQLGTTGGERWDTVGRFFYFGVNVSLR